MVSRTSQWFIAFAICSAFAALPFLTTYRMPMSDLPQHAAQITLWKAFYDGCYRFGATHELNFLTPYLFGYSIARLIALFASVNAALKFTAYLAVLALPLAMRLFALRSGIDDWIALAGFPIAFGFSFYWGFLNFLVALPIGLLLVWAQERFSLSRIPRRAFLVAAIGLLLVASHVVAFAVFAAVAGAVHLANSKSAKQALTGLLPLVVPAAALVAWVASSRMHETRAQTPTLWGLGFYRLVAFPSMLVGSTSDSEGVACVFAIAAIVAVAGVRFTRDWKRWIPAAVAAAAYLLIPFSLLGQTLMNQRFAVPIAAFLLIALEPRPPIVRRALARTLIVAVVALWMLGLAARFHRFDREARGFDRLIGLVPSNQKVLLLSVVGQSESVPGAPFLHFAGYYQERKGGINGWSFAKNFPSLVRYRAGLAVPWVSPIESYDPRYFHFDRAPAFDAYFVRAPGDMSALLFGRANELTLRGRAGLWWLYERRGSDSQCSPIEPDALDRRPVLSWD